MNELVVKLMLKTGAFSKDLKTAKGEIQQFRTGCQNAGKGIEGFTKSLGINIGSLTKFAGGVGVAVAVGKEFKNIIESSQTTSDAFAVAIAGAKGAVEAFETAIATFDFSSFRSGLWNVINDSKEFAKAMDQLGNTQIAFDYLSKVNYTSFREAYTVFKDPKATKEMKEDAKKQMQEAIDAQYEYANNYNKQAYNAYVSQVVKKAGSANLKAFRVTQEQFNKAMKIDLSANPDEGRSKNQKEYDSYLKQLKEYGKNNLSAQDDLKKEYADVIAIHAMLELMKDDELKGLGELLQGMEDAKQVAIGMENTMNKAIGKSETSGQDKVNANKITALKEELELEEGSVAKLKEALAIEQKKLDAMKSGSDEFSEQVKKVDELNKKLQEEETHVRAITTRLREQELGKLPALDSNRFRQNAQVSTPYTPPKVDNVVEDLEIQADAVANTMTTWDAFNMSMANTSTIVSNLSNVFSGMTEMSTAGILQMVATTLPAIASLVSAIGALTAAEAVEAGVGAVAKGVSTAVHWIEAIAAVAALGAVVAGAIAAAKAQGQGFATGGIVGGNSFTGDRVPARVNSGEMILNRGQQASLWRQINGGNTGNMVEFHISGTELVGVLNNNNRKSKLTR